MPTILLDKSAFQALTPAEHELLGRFTHHIIPPLLIMEILGDAAKEDTPGSNPWVQVLSRKFNGSGHPVAGEWEILVGASLAGRERPIGRQVPITHGELRRGSDGALGLVIRDHPLNASIMRWAQGQMTASEQATASHWRNNEFRFDLMEFSRWVVGDSVSVPKATTIQDSVAKATELLGREQLTRVWIDRAARLAGYDRSQADDFQSRPFLDGMTFMQAAPLAYKFMLGFLSTLIAWQNQLIGNHTNNTKDAMYFCYLPFAVCFVSDDKLHKRIAPYLKEDTQELLTSGELRQELSLISEEASRRGLQITYWTPGELRDLADRSKLIRGLSRYVRIPTISGNQSDSTTPVAIVRDRIVNSEVSSPTNNLEEIQWLAYETTLPRSIAELRYGKENLPDD